jgi:hypothetical protein
VRWLAERLAWLQSARAEYTFVYSLSSVDGRTFWYLIHRGRVRSVVAAPHDATSRRAAMSAIEAVYSPESQETLAVPADQVENVLLIAGWFRKRPDERLRLISPKDALARCAAGAAIASVPY